MVQDVKTSKINNGNTHNGNVIGFSVSLQNGGTWNVLGDSFVNHLELKDGGIIKVDSAEGKGTTFTLLIPALEG